MRSPVICKEKTYHFPCFVFRKRAFNAAGRFYVRARRVFAKRERIVTSAFQFENLCAAVLGEFARAYALAGNLQGKGVPFPMLRISKAPEQQNPIYSRARSSANYEAGTRHSPRFVFLKRALNAAGWFHVCACRVFAKRECIVTSAFQFENLCAAVLGEFARAYALAGNFQGKGAPFPMLRISKAPEQQNPIYSRARSSANYEAGARHSPRFVFRNSTLNAAGCFYVRACRVFVKRERIVTDAVQFENSRSAVLGKFARAYVITGNFQGKSVSFPMLRASNAPVQWRSAYTRACSPGNAEARICNFPRSVFEKRLRNEAGCFRAPARRVFIRKENAMTNAAQLKSCRAVEPGGFVCAYTLAGHLLGGHVLFPMLRISKIHARQNPIYSRTHSSVNHEMGARHTCASYFQSAWITQRDAFEHTLIGHFRNRSAR